MSNTSGRTLERQALERMMDAANTESIAIANAGIAASVPHHRVFHHIAMKDHLGALDREAQKAKSTTG